MDKLRHVHASCEAFECSWTEGCSIVCSAAVIQSDHWNHRGKRQHAHPSHMQTVVPILLFLGAQGPHHEARSPLPSYVTAHRHQQQDADWRKAARISLIHDTRSSLYQMPGQFTRAVRRFYLLQSPKQIQTPKSCLLELSM